MPVNSLDNKKLNKNEMIDKIKNPENPAIIDQIPSYETINPERPNIEIYKKNIVLGQTILIVMTVKILFSNIKSLSYNYPNKTEKDAAIFNI